MKSTLVLLLALAAITVGASAQTTTAKLRVIEVNLDGGAHGTGTFDVTVTFNGTDFVKREAVPFDCTDAQTTVTVNGQTYTYAEVVAVLKAISEQERVGAAGTQKAAAVKAKADADAAAAKANASKP